MTAESYKPTLDFQQAQSDMNFVVLEPTLLPSGCALFEGTVRTETPSSRASYRFIVRGSGRQFRVKQFFYDWMHPTLADTNLDLPGQAFVAQGIVGFFGPDYKGNHAACWSKWFTQVELSVLDGEFSDEEMVTFFEGLRPATEEAIEEIGRKPFALTSYSARFHVSPWGTDEVSRTLGVRFRICSASVRRLLAAAIKLQRLRA